MSGSKAIRLFLFFVFALLIQLASASSSIVGFVTIKGPDAPVGPIANAFVMVANPAFPKQTIAVGQTNTQGFYSISGLAPGTYMVTFSKPGFLQGICGSFTLPDNTSAQINAQLVPSLTGTEVAKNNVKDETAYTIHNPNNFSVHFTWTLPQHHATGTGTAPPGDSIIDPNQWPHSENISLFVDGSQVQKVTTTVVAPPIVVGNLTGYVQNPGGSPLAGVQVVLSDSSNTPIGTAFTLTDGSYIFANEPAATYSLAYSLNGYVSASQTFSLPVGGGQAPTIKLAPVPVPPTATLNVNVNDPSGPVPGATVAVTYADNKTVSGATDGNGFISFTNQEVGVAATILATANDGSGRTASVSTAGLVPGVNVITVSLPPIPKGSVSGGVNDLGTSSGIPGAQVVLLDASNNVVASTTTAPDGTYSIGGISPGTYSMTFSATNYVTFSDGGIVISSGGNTNETVSLQSTLATVTITVVDAVTGAPRSAQITIVYADGTISDFQNTDGNGMATFTGQPSGVAATLQGALLDANGLKISMSIPTGFAPGINNVTFTVPTILSNVAGTIRDAATQQPIAGASITLVDAVTQFNYTATSAADGTYAINGVPASKYVFKVTAPNYNGFNTSFGVEPSMTLTENAMLTPIAQSTATVNVAVVDGSTNQPLLRANVTINLADGKSYGPTSVDPSGTAHFSNVEMNVSATVTATVMDGTGRTGTLTTTFNLLTNNISVTVGGTQPNNGSVIGFLYDTTKGLPITGQAVELDDLLLGLPVATGTTDRNGNFSLSAPGGSYRFVTHSLTYGTLTRNVTVTSGQTFNMGAIGLTPTIDPSLASVMITVIDGSTNLPVQGVALNIVYQPGVAGIPTLLTDVNGQATYVNQPVGLNATVNASAPDGRTASFNNPFGWRAGPNNVTLTLPATAVGTITGRVTDSLGKTGLSGVSIVATDRSGKVFAQTISDLKGNYTLNGLTIGAAYTVTFSLQGYQTLTASVAGGAVYNAILQQATNFDANVTVSLMDNRGAPVVGTVTITYSDGSPSVSGSTGFLPGQVTFTNQPSGVVANISGVSADGTKSASQSTTFVSGANAVTLTLITQPGTIAGMVADSTTGTPLANAQVSVFDWNNNEVATTTSDGAGNYKVLNLLPGSYSVTFDLAGYTPVTLTIAVTSGNVSQGNVQLTPTTATVQVQVLEHSGALSVGASVTINYADGTSAGPVLTDSRGNANFSNEPTGLGATISVVTANGQPTSVSQKGGFVAGTNFIRVTMPLAGEVKGVVTDATTGKAIAGASVAITDSLGNSLGQATTDVAGSYDLKAINPGFDNVTFSANGYVTQSQLVNVFGGMVSTANASLGLAPNPSNANVSITVLDTTGVGIGDAVVTIHYSNGAPSAVGRTDPTTAIATFQGLLVGVPATITVDANDGSSRTGTVDVPNGFQSPPALNVYSVTVSNQAPTSGNLVGTVTDSAGNPLAGVQVSVTNGGKPVGSATTNGKGNYSITSLFAGTFTVTFSLNGYQTISVANVAITSGNTTTQDATLTAANPMDATVTVTVTSGGNPSPGATVVLDYGALNPGGIPVVGQTDPFSGIVTFTNQLVGVPCIIGVTLNDQTQLPARSSAGFASGASSPSNILYFAN